MEQQQQVFQNNLGTNKYSPRQFSQHGPPSSKIEIINHLIDQMDLTKNNEPPFSRIKNNDLTHSVDKVNRYTQSYRKQTPVVATKAKAVSQVPSVVKKTFNSNSTRYESNMVVDEEDSKNDMRFKSYISKMDNSQEKHGYKKQQEQLRKSVQISTTDNRQPMVKSSIEQFDNTNCRNRQEKYFNKFEEIMHNYD